MSEPTARQYGGIKSQLTKDKTQFDKLLKGYQDSGLAKAANNAQYESLKRYLDKYKVGTDTFSRKVQFHAELYNAKKRENPDYTDLVYTENWAYLDTLENNITDMELGLNVFASDLQTTLERSRNEQDAFQAMAAIGAAGAAVAPPKLIPKPKELSKTSSFQEFSEWKKSIATYVKYYKIEQLDLDSQQTILKGFVDEELETFLDSHFDADVGVPVFSVTTPNTWMNCLVTFFDNMYPKHCRIIDFMTSKQKSGEQVSMFLKRIKSEAVQADYRNITPEKMLIYTTVLGIRDDNLRLKLAKKLDTLTFDEMEKEVANFERISAFNSSVTKSFVQEVTSDPPSLEAISTYKSQQNRKNQSVYSRGQAPRGRGQFANRGRFKPRNNYQCRGDNCTISPYWRCRSHCRLEQSQIQSLESRFGHQYPKRVNELVVDAVHHEHVADDDDYAVTDDGYTDYTAEDASLFSGTQYVGHVETLDVNNNKTFSIDYIETVTNATEDVTGIVPMDDPLKTPMIWLQMCDRSDIGDLSCMPRVQCLPDSGAMVSICSEDFARQLGLKIDRTRIGDIFTANGTRLDTIGTVDIKGHYQGIRVLFSSYVTRNQRAQVPYLSWRLMKRFYLLHPEWPLPLQKCDFKKIPPVFGPTQWQKGRFTRSVRKWQDFVLDANEDFSEVFNQVDQTFVDSNLKDLKEEFSSVFDTAKTDNKIKMKPVEINFRSDVPVKPYVTTCARATPFAIRDAANKELENYLRTGVLRKPYPNEKIDWLAPGMWIPKPSGDGARLITCGQKLNQFIQRKPHQFQPPLDLLRSIPPGQKFFLSLDCFRGYFQVPLAPQDQAKTAFLLREHGVHLYTVLPMGNSLSSDEFCRITDEIIAPCKNILKLIDDILIYAKTLEELFDHFRALLERCLIYNLTLNPKKIQVAKKLKFAGYMVSSKGIHMCDDKIDTIKNFEVPKTVTDVRSFIGCALQFKYHAPQLMGHLQPLIKLTSTKNDTHVLTETPKRGRKSRPIEWNDFYQDHFEKVKLILTSAGENVLTPYDPSKTLFIYTDASREKGLGFCALQFYDGYPKLVECGSQTITDCARNTYSVSELECLAVLQSLVKLRLYTVGNSNVVVCSDHQALCGMKKKTLDQMESPRLMRMFEKLNAYSFELRFVRGKHNVIADFMSRYPVNGTPANEFDGHTLNEITLESVELFQGKISDFNVELFQSEAKKCPEYSQLLELFKTDVSSNKIPKDHPARLYRQHWDSFSVQDGLILLEGRILVPMALRQKVLDSLHIAHLGITKTRQLANQLYFWHNMSTHIGQMIDKCSQCQINRPLPQQDPIIQTVAEFPMDHCSIDAGEHNGKKYLVMADRFTGFLWAKQMKKLTSKDCINTLNSWFRHFGYPWHLRSDGASNFTSSEFENFMEKHYILHQVSSSYYSESNGHAEAAIKVLKSFAKKAKNDDELQNMILEYNSCPLGNGALSPMESMFGYRKKSNLPMFRHQALKIPDEVLQASEERKIRYREKSAFYKNRHSRKIPRSVIPVGTPVFIYSKISNNWDMRGTVVSHGKNPRSYKVVGTTGGTYWKNRKFLREDKTQNFSNNSDKTVNSIIFDNAIQ